MPSPQDPQKSNGATTNTPLKAQKQPWYLPSASLGLTLLILLPPILLISIDLFLKPLPPVHSIPIPYPLSYLFNFDGSIFNVVIPPSFHIDDLAKLWLVSPLAIYLIWAFDFHLGLAGTFISCLFCSMYLHGFGVNQSVNALDSYTSKLMKSQPHALRTGLFQGEQLVLDERVEDAIYFWDEKYGHIESVICYYGMVIRWLYMRMSTPRSLKNDKTDVFLTESWFTFSNILRGVGGGWSSGLMFLEAQCCEMSLAFDMVILSMLIVYRISSSYKRSTSKKYDVVVFWILVSTFGRLAHNLFWFYHYSAMFPGPDGARRFVEPSELKQNHLGTMEVLSFGLMERSCSK